MLLEQSLEGKEEPVQMHGISETALYLPSLTLEARHKLDHALPAPIPWHEAVNFSNLHCPHLLFQQLESTTLQVTLRLPLCCSSNMTRSYGAGGTFRDGCSRRTLPASMFHSLLLPPFLGTCQHQEVYILHLACRSFFWIPPYTKPAPLCACLCGQASDHDTLINPTLYSPG